MDFNTRLIQLTASIVFVIKRFFGLIFSPYQTMRKISVEKDQLQPLIVLLFVYLYFQFGYKVRPFPYRPLIIFGAFLLYFLFTVCFLYCFSKIVWKAGSFKSYFNTVAFSLFPTLIWFITNSVLYFFIPPPRTFSIWGKGFSVFFIAFSLSLLLWKIILSYLAVRFSTKLDFYRIMFLIIIYLCLFLPASVLMYQLRIFRIPFI